MLNISHEWNESSNIVLSGYILSIIFTLIAYFTVKENCLQGWHAIIAVFGFGTLQAFFQLVFFLNLGIEPTPRWDFLMFCFMLIMVVILVGGSIWIMHNLDYNMMMMPHKMSGM
jgi:cytochrome o ubiquinol oxidase operon protein cyoD